MFKKASKKQCKLRLALMGIAGSGKTYSALRIASGLSDKIAVADTESGTASKYSDLFSFDVCEMKNHSPQKLIEVINEAENAGYEVLIIDSLSHSWKALLEHIENLTSTKFSGNSFRAWGQGTPIQRQLIDTILNSKLHIIATMRAKTEYAVSVNDKGKAEPKRMGLGAEQGKEIEYEFDILFELNSDNSAKCVKTRYSKFKNQFFIELTEEHGKELKEWLSDGEEVQEVEYMNVMKLTSILNEKNINIGDFCKFAGITQANISEFTLDDINIRIDEFNESK